MQILRDSNTRQMELTLNIVRDVFLEKSIVPNSSVGAYNHTPLSNPNHAINLSTRMMTIALLIFILIITATGCGPSKITRHMRATGYCACGECCGWERGRWLYLKLDFWNKYISTGKNKGQPYSGLTASGTKPHEPQDGLFSIDTIIHPWMIRMHVPEYGYGIVEDRGSAIKGPKRIDLFFDSHSEALEWGNQYVDVDIYK